MSVDWQTWVKSNPRWLLVSHRTTTLVSCLVSSPQLSASTLLWLSDSLNSIIFHMRYLSHLSSKEFNWKDLCINCLHNWTLVYELQAVWKSETTKCIWHFSQILKCKVHTYIFSLFQFWEATDCQHDIWLSYIHITSKDNFFYVVLDKKF